MATIENNLLLQTSNDQDAADFHKQLNLDLDTLGLDKPDMLRPAVDKLNKLQVNHFNPVRFRFIESMLEKALQHRQSVAEIIEKKALQALSDYVKEYASFQKSTESPHGRKEHSHKDHGQNNRNQGRLAKLTQEMFQSGETDASVSKPTLEDELRQQENDIMHSVAAIMIDKSIVPASQKSKTDYNELSAMRHFRQSKVKHTSERLFARTIQEGPEDAGPLNSQALIIRSLTTMRDLSPGYINRFISYMDTLLWLEQASEEGAKTKTKTKKNKGRRKS